MHRLVSNLIIYRNIGEDSILHRLAGIFKRLETVASDTEELAGEVRHEIHRLLELATVYAFDEDLWRDYIAYLLAMTENPFTLACEKRGAVDGSVNVFADSDMSVFSQLLDFDFSEIEKKLGLNCFSVIRDYKAVPKSDDVCDRNAGQRIRELGRELKDTKGADDLKGVLMAFYERYGVGRFGMNKAFRIAAGDGEAKIIPITAAGDAAFADITGYEDQKERLRQNTESFLSGRPANNVLLYGDAGTGKSTCIKALLNEYYDQGLRIIEVYKHDFQYLPDIISEIKGRNYRFVIYMDDLSFEGFETEYKYLKAVIEGDLEARPENVLIYATSNRRHLIRESFGDRRDREGDLHPNETMAEMMSLYDRFGVTIAFFKPEREVYYRIVQALAKKRLGADQDNDDLLKKADVWALRHGGMSGRTAKQFVDHMAGISNE